MICSIYQLREVPDWCIFDRDLVNPSNAQIKRI